MTCGRQPYAVAPPRTPSPACGPAPHPCPSPLPAARPSARCPADQIVRVAKALAHTAKFRSALVNGGADMGTQKEQLERPLDVLVGTPQRVMQHAGGCWVGHTRGLGACGSWGGCWRATCAQSLETSPCPPRVTLAPPPPPGLVPRLAPVCAEKSNVYYGDVEVVVLDEADTMFDRGFGPEVKAILAAVRGKPRPARCVLVSATMTKAVRRLIGGSLGRTARWPCSACCVPKLLGPACSMQGRSCAGHVMECEKPSGVPAPSCADSPLAHLPSLCDCCAHPRSAPLPLLHFQPQPCPLCRGGFPPHPPDRDVHAAPRRGGRAAHLPAAATLSQQARPPAAGKRCAALSHPSSAPIRAAYGTPHRLHPPAVVTPPRARCSTLPCACIYAQALLQHRPQPRLPAAGHRGRAPAGQEGHGLLQHTGLLQSRWARAQATLGGCCGAQVPLHLPGPSAGRPTCCRQGLIAPKYCLHPSQLQARGAGRPRPAQPGAHRWPPPPRCPRCAADHFLTERGLQTACYHGDVPVEDRKAAIQAFAASEGGRPPLLVCTDLAAR